MLLCQLGARFTISIFAYNFIKLIATDYKGLIEIALDNLTVKFKSFNCYFPKKFNCRIREIMKQAG